MCGFIAFRPSSCSSFATFMAIRASAIFSRTHARRHEGLIGCVNVSSRASLPIAPTSRLGGAMVRAFDCWVMLWG
jgi:hypothetical protein